MKMLRNLMFIIYFYAGVKFQVRIFNDRSICALTNCVCVCIHWFWVSSRNSKFRARKTNNYCLLAILPSLMVFWWTVCFGMWYALDDLTAFHWQSKNKNCCLISPCVHIMESKIKRSKRKTIMERIKDVNEPGKKGWHHHQHSLCVSH